MKSLPGKIGRDFFVAEENKMGTWGHNAFENDDAIDFIGKLEGKNDAAVRTTFNETFDSVLNSESPDASVCSSAIAAAEFVAKANGHHSKGTPDEARQWLDEHNFSPSKSLTQKAARTCRKIVQESELKDLWGKSSVWKKSVGRTIERLERAPKRLASNATSTLKSAADKKSPRGSAIARLKQNSIYIQFEKRKPVYAALNPNNINNELVTDLIATPSLTHIDLSGVVASETNPFNALADVKQLKIVWAGDCQGLRDEHLTFCRSLSELTSLSVRDQEITDQGIDHLKSCYGLKVLNIDGTAVTDAGLEIACGGKSINYLSAIRTRISGKAFKSFLCDSLEHVDLEASQLSNRGLDALCQISRNIKILSIAHCQKVTDKGLSHLANLKNAEQLWLGGSNLNGSGFGFLQALKNLKFLFVFESSPDFCKNVAKHLQSSHIEHLQINGPFETEDLESIVTAKQLRVIELVDSNVPKLFAKRLGKECGIEIHATQY